MNLQLLEDLRESEDANVHTRASSTAFETLKTRSRIVLPRDHEELLRQSNGIEAYAGHVRLFGIDTDESIDSIRWNQHEFWKFAWETRCIEYWSFAETAWGDQYAYLSFRRGLRSLFSRGCLNEIRGCGEFAHRIFLQQNLFAWQRNHMTL